MSIGLKYHSEIVDLKICLNIIKQRMKGEIMQNHHNVKQFGKNSNKGGKCNNSDNLQTYKPNMTRKIDLDPNNSCSQVDNPT